MSTNADGASWATGEAYTKMMQRWRDALEEMSGAEGFAATSEKFLKAFVEQQAARAEIVERWAQAMQEMAGSDAFAAASGQLLALYAQQQQALRAASRATAEALEIPTTDDLAETSRLVVNVERKVDEVTDQLTALGARLDGIEAALRDLAAAAAAPPPAPERNPEPKPETPAPAPARAKRPSRRRTAPPPAEG
jgi:hypothetical protein